ncbi:J domain-containing protein [Brunnivagina elsteri]|uniref:Molecular chaperone DnaJ n=1 Tax=Brunnivagina elsteri CCALA 953 TaxID=987040 RepID=A0A2A2TE61_9CYAN|nr:DnaJ domain-containing protein [Calothrix elsteri]PAX52022.1 molecular chaperone DnaJ [Calothrix elsteri CCALA 953]
MSDRMDIYRAYEVLGLMPSASQEEIKQAYRQLVKIWHPDGFTDIVKKQQAEERIKIINGAYRKLKSDASSFVNPPSSNPVTKAKPQNYQNSPNKNNSQYSPPPRNSTKVNPKKTNPQQKASNAERFYEYGVENVGLGKYEDAINDFTQAIRINPYYIEAYKYRGLLCSQLGYELRATADLTKAAQLEMDFRGKYSKTPAAYSRYQYKPVYKKGNSKSEPLCDRICQVFKKWFRFKRK